MSKLANSRCAHVEPGDRFTCERLPGDEVHTRKGRAWGGHVFVPAELDGAGIPARSNSGAVTAIVTRRDGMPSTRPTTNERRELHATQTAYADAWKQAITTAADLLEDRARERSAGGGGDTSARELRHAAAVIRALPCVRVNS